jgi:hypothetical protein
MAGAGAILGAGWLAGETAVAVFLVHGVLGMWMTAGAPEAFVRLGLARRSVPRATATAVDGHS